jgi:hypothetical protein
MSEITQARQIPLFDVGPLLAKVEDGPEPSIRQMVRSFYNRDAINDPDGATEQYLAALMPHHRSVASFIEAIHERTPTGASIVVQHHPNGDWSVAEHPLPRTPNAGSEADGAQKRIDRLNRTATDRAYMIEALAQMLGPKARQVWASWQAQGVQRIHSDWVIDPMSMDGEDVAQVHLDMHEAMKSAVVVDNIDEHIATRRFDEPFSTPTQPHQGRGDVT